MTSDPASTKLVQHPATARLFRDAADRWMKLRVQHRIACDRMWAGTIASNFTKDELTLLESYLCPNDRALLEALEHVR